ncbi:1088_t:CDS:2, partial [Acaulospora morrowiae]
TLLTIMDFSDTVRELLSAKARESGDDSSWAVLCGGLLQEESHNLSTLDELSLHLYQCIQSCVSSKVPKDSRFDKGILERPFYLALVEMLKTCFENGGEFPQSVKQSKLFLLENTNLQRLKEIEEEMKRILDLWNVFPNVFDHWHKDTLDDYLFKFLTPRDLNTFLGLRTTTGSATDLPPSLIECIDSFTRRHVKRVRPNIVNTLTVGAKAFSKHSHRDVSNSFWGVCTGCESDSQSLLSSVFFNHLPYHRQTCESVNLIAEKQKNEQANQILAKVITDAAWINLHSLPHETRVFEVRNSRGYGARWEIQPSQSQSEGDSGIENSPSEDQRNRNRTIVFRGFLEPQMEDGHEKGWIH